MSNIEPYKAIVEQALKNMSDEEVSAFMQYFRFENTRGWLQGSLTCAGAGFLCMIAGDVIGTIISNKIRKHESEKES